MSRPIFLAWFTQFQGEFLGTGNSPEKDYSSQGGKQIYIKSGKILAISVKGFNDNVCIFNLDNLALCVNKDRFPCDHVSDEQRYYQAKISFQKTLL